MNQSPYLPLSEQRCWTDAIKDEALEALGHTLSLMLQGHRMSDEAMRAPLEAFRPNQSQVAYLPLARGHRRRMVAYCDKQLELILIAWGEGTQTPVHDHAKNGCLMLGVAGKLEEKRYNTKLQYVKTNLLTAGVLRYIDNTEGYHKIGNLAAGGSLSLHVYSPPLHQPKQWCL